MRRLLERPDLEQLRHQAREPQRASGDPIRLGETQLRLAREYGFPSWTALKSEVLRRRGSPSAVDYRIRSVATREELVTAYDLMGAQFEPPVTHFPSRVRKPRPLGSTVTVTSCSSPRAMGSPAVSSLTGKVVR